MMLLDVLGIDWFAK